jgi:hypothetical protein
VLLEISGQGKNPERRVETPMLLDDRGVLADKLVEARRIYQQDFHNFVPWLRRRRGMRPQRFDPTEFTELPLLKIWPI